MSKIRKTHIKTILVIISLICNFSFLLFVFYHWSSVFRPMVVGMIKSRPTLFKIAKATVSIFREQELDAQQLASMENNINKLIELIDKEIQGFSSETERIDYIRNFIYTNSIHKGGEEYAWDTRKVLSMMSESYMSQENPPHLTCGSRTYAMKAILDKLEIDNRIIMIFTDNAARVHSHTFLEVLNRDTNRWEIHDPDLNLYYQNVNTLSRASTVQLVLGNVEDFEPCSSDSFCGWEEHNLRRFVENRRFGAVLYDNRKHLERQIFNRKPVYEKSVIVVNTDRFSITKKFPGNENKDFIQFANEHYGNPVFIFNQQFE